jgi:hypothetical protein
MTLDGTDGTVVVPIRPAAVRSWLKSLTNVLAAADPPAGAPRFATNVVMTPTATLVTKSASTSPLIARNPVCGLSASRRPAISMAGRRVHRRMALEPIMVSHGPAMTSPAMTTKKPGR